MAAVFSMLFVKTPHIIKKLIPSVTWDIPTTEKVVYLTFDDGPTPEITEWVLAQLEVFNAKATFFCIGKNIEEHTDIFNKVVSAGHAIGNHTHNHLNAWKTSKENYLNNTLKAETTLLNKYPEFAQKKLFRPPYGKFTPAIIKQLKSNGNKVIGWDIISEDYDQKKTAEAVFNNVMNHITPGSIVVFHDSVKAFKNLEKVLPKVLQNLQQQGYRFKAI